MKPQKLSWITVPLLISLVLQILGLLVLPFLIPLIDVALTSVANAPNSGLGPQELRLVRSLTGTTLWALLLLGVFWAALIYFTYGAVQDGRSWSRIAALVIAVTGLINFPVGTVLGVLILMGSFDPEVQGYLSR